METPTDLTHSVFHNEKEARSYLESLRWPSGTVCPFCKRPDSVKTLGGESMGDGWYHCASCRQKFTVRVGSIFERSHVPLHKWLLAFRLMASSKKGVSAHQLHRSLAVTYKTAWFMSMRIREAMEPPVAAPLGTLSGPESSGIVEVDETYHGNKNEIVKRTKRGEAALSSKRSIVALVERRGAVRSFHVERADKETILKIISEHVASTAKVNTDESYLYRGGWQVGVGT